MSNPDVKDYYDNYVEYQSKTGINLRLYKIYNKLKKNGFKNGMSILEIGCGLGTLTQLIASNNSKSKIVATDISSKSIIYAKQYLRKFNNVELICLDSVEFEYDFKFDFIILPDVIEHIPIINHDQLFSKLIKCTHPKSKLLINMPSPWYQEFLFKHKPELLQVVDQSIDSSTLLNNAYSNNFELLLLESYSIWKPEFDYQFVVFRPKSSYNSFDNFSKIYTLLDRIIYYIKYIFNTK